MFLTFIPVSMWKMPYVIPERGHHHRKCPALVNTPKNSSEAAHEVNCPTNSICLLKNNNCAQCFSRVEVQVFLQFMGLCVCVCVPPLLLYSRCLLGKDVVLKLAEDIACKKNHLESLSGGISNNVCG